MAGEPARIASPSWLVWDLSKAFSTCAPKESKESCFQTCTQQKPYVSSHHEGFRRPRTGKCSKTGS